MRMFLNLLLPVLVAAQDWVPFSDIPSDSPSRTFVLGGRLLSFTAAGPMLSDDSGGTWRRSAAGITGVQASLVAASNGDAALVFAGGRMYRSADRGDSWQAWSEGLEVPNTAYHGLALGDTVAMATFGIFEYGDIWRRTTHTNWSKVQPILDTSVAGWKRAVPRLSLENDIFWSGKRFIMSDDVSGDHAVWMSDDGLKWKLSLVGVDQSSLALRSDTLWCLRDSKWLHSADHGSSWDSLAVSAAGLWRLFPVGQGFLTRRNDTSLYFDSPTRTFHPLPISTGEYLFGAWTMGNRLVAIAESGQFLSIDSGKTWRSFPSVPNNSVPYSLVRTGSDWLALTDGGVSSSTDLRSWRLEEGTSGIRDLRRTGGRLYGLGWDLLRRTTAGWIKDSVGPSPGYSENHYWIAGDSALRWLTNGAGLWISPGTSIRWTIRDTFPNGFGGMTAFEKFGGRLWFARTNFTTPTPTVLQTYDPSTTRWDTVDVPHSVGASAIASAGARLWVGTDSGLFQSDDTGRTFHPSAACVADRRLGLFRLAVSGDTVAVQCLSQVWYFLHSEESRSSISFDGGKSWTNSVTKDLASSSYWIDSTGIFSGMLGRGLWKWGVAPGTRLLDRASRGEAPLVVARQGRMEIVRSNQTESVFVEILDHQGRVLEKARFGPGVQAVPWNGAKGLHPVRLRMGAQNLTQTLLVP